MKQKLKEELKAFFPVFWENYRHFIFYPSLFFCVPAVLQLAGFSKTGLCSYWILIAFVSLDILLRLPRFIKAVRTHTSKPYIGWCLVDWSVSATAVLIGTLFAKAVGLF